MTNKKELKSKLSIFSGLYEYRPIDTILSSSKDLTNDDIQEIKDTVASISTLIKRQRRFFITEETQAIEWVSKLDVNVKNETPEEEAPEVKEEKPAPEVKEPEVKEEKPEVKEEKPAPEVKEPEVKEETPEVKEETPEVKDETPEVKEEKPASKSKKK